MIQESFAGINFNSGDFFEDWRKNQRLKQAVVINYLYI